MKAHLVDGTFELFRCFHGAPRATTTAGIEVGAVRGLLQTLTSLIKGDDVSHVALVFDPMAPAQGARAAESPLRSQVPLAVEAVRALGIRLWPMVRYQADDGLATGAAKFRDAVDQVVLCTTDLDLTQCVRGDRVVLLDRIRTRITNEEAVRARFGVDPVQVPEVLALVGDKSDGIHGIEGWGLKTTAALLTRYRRIEDIPADASDWEVDVRGAQRLARNLAARRDEAILCRNLSVLRDDLPIPDDLDAIAWCGPDWSALQALCATVEDDTVIARLR